MRTVPFAAIVTSLLCGPSFAEDLTITGQAEVVWNRVSESSPVYLLGIENTTGTTDMLMAWQLSLRVICAPDAMGTVEFNTATLPPDYLLDGRSGGLAPPFRGPSSEIARIGDIDAGFVGVPIPHAGKNLLQVDFVASGNARGRFDIELCPFDADQSSYWFSVDRFSETEFLNGSTAGGASVVGSILVVPEPSGAVVMWGAITPLLVLVLLRCRLQASRHRGLQTQAVCAAHPAANASSEEEQCNDLRSVRLL